MAVKQFPLGVSMQRNENPVSEERSVCKVTCMLIFERFLNSIMAKKPGGLRCLMHKNDNIGHHNMILPGLYSAHEMPDRYDEHNRCISTMLQFA